MDKLIAKTFVTYKDDYFMVVTINRKSSCDSTLYSITYIYSIVYFVHNNSHEIIKLLHEIEGFDNDISKHIEVCREIHINGPDDACCIPSISYE